MGSPKVRRLPSLHVQCQTTPRLRVREQRKAVHDISGLQMSWANMWHGRCEGAELSQSAICYILYVPPLLNEGLCSVARAGCDGRNWWWIDKAFCSYEEAIPYEHVHKLLRDLSQPACVNSPCLHFLDTL